MVSGAVACHLNSPYSALVSDVEKLSTVIAPARFSGLPALIPVLRAEYVTRFLVRALSEKDCKSRPAIRPTCSPPLRHSAFSPFCSCLVSPPLTQASFIVLILLAGEEGL